MSRRSSSSAPIVVASSSRQPRPQGGALALLVERDLRRRLRVGATRPEGQPGRASKSSSAGARSPGQYRRPGAATRRRPRSRGPARSLPRRPAAHRGRRSAREARRGWGRRRDWVRRRGRPCRRAAVCPGRSRSCGPGRPDVDELLGRAAADGQLDGPAGEGRPPRRSLQRERPFQLGGPGDTLQRDGGRRRSRTPPVRAALATGRARRGHRRRVGAGPGPPAPGAPPRRAGESRSRG